MWFVKFYRKKYYYITIKKVKKKNVCTRTFFTFILARPITFFQSSIVSLTSRMCKIERMLWYWNKIMCLGTISYLFCEDVYFKYMYFKINK